MRLTPREVSIKSRTGFQFTHPGKGATGRTLPPERVQRMFQFTHPGKGATLLVWTIAPLRSSFNSRTLGRVRPVFSGCGESSPCVSIHAPWEGCDTKGGGRSKVASVFQFTHPGKGATIIKDNVGFGEWFQFTHPGKGATNCIYWCDYSHRFNSRTLGRVRRPCSILWESNPIVSIHAPWEGCDCESDYPLLGLFQFQFTHPGKGAT